MFAAEYQSGVGNAESISNGWVPALPPPVCPVSLSVPKLTLGSGSTSTPCPATPVLLLESSRSGKREAVEKTKRCAYLQGSDHYSLPSASMLPRTC